MTTMSHDFIQKALKNVMESQMKREALLKAYVNGDNNSLTVEKMREALKTLTGEGKMQQQVGAGINRFQNIEVGIQRQGTKITLPNDPTDMSLDEAIDCLHKIKKEQETVISVNEIVDAFPFDGAVAFMHAMKEVYGWATPVPTQTFFGPKPPTTLSIEIGYKVYTTIIWGRFKIPGISGELATGVSRKDGRPVFCIQGEVLKKDQDQVRKLAELTRHIVETMSIYKGQAVKLVTNEDGEIMFDAPPKFLDLSGVNPEELTFSEETKVQVQTNLFTPIEHTQRCREAKVPLKRGILLEGPYGTGKTLTAFVAAQKCVNNKWTFILVDRVSGLKSALDFAKLYSPAIVFAEDIDRSVSGDERTVEIDDILNMIDGVEAKGSEIITVLTSNHVENINKAMLRPGRLDAVISVQAPDAQAVEKLIRIYSRDLLQKGTDLSGAGKILAGRIPAVIREAVERAKLYTIGRDPDAETIEITGDDLVAAAVGMKNHLDLLNPKVETDSVEQRFTNSFKEVMAEGIKSNGLYSTVQNIKSTVEEIQESLN